MLPHRAAKLPWSRPLADLVPAIIEPVLTRRGFGAGGLVLFWEDIVGERLAAVSHPLKVQWLPRPPGFAEASQSMPAALVVRVESGFALELQLLAPIIIERINAHFGWRRISQLKLKQGPVPQPAGGKPLARLADPSAEEAAQRLIDTSVSEPLRQALTRLGARVLARP